MPKRCVVPVMPMESQKRWTASSPTRSTTVPVQVLSLTMIIITSASRKVIQKPGVRCWNVPESLSWYFASMVTFWSRASLPSWTALRAAIMMEILRVLAEGTGTSPIRSARWPVVEVFQVPARLEGQAVAQLVQGLLKLAHARSSVGRRASAPRPPRSRGRDR